MSKKGKKQDPERAAERRLAKAQLKLQEAQETQTQERVRGQQEVERASLRAAKWLTRGAQRVEQRAQAVAQAEADLIEMREGRTGGIAKTSSPEAAADRLEGLETKGDPKSSVLLVVPSAGETSANGATHDKHDAVTKSDISGAT